MSIIFISSTYEDLKKHREAIINTLERMKQNFSAMEYFGSRTDDAVAVCRQEITDCDIFIGIYAWRYGWVPADSLVSITEMEFDFASRLNKDRLCYIIDEQHPWTPSLIDKGDKAEKLGAFKQKVSKLVRSIFTTPDNLAKMVAADLARELSPPRAPTTVGGLLQINWDCLAPDLQQVFLGAYTLAKKDSAKGIVSTRHVFSAMASMPTSAANLLYAPAMPSEPLQDLQAKIHVDDAVALPELFGLDKMFSACVFGSIQRLLPSHSPTQRIMAIELTADLLKNGVGDSVAKFRQAGVDGDAVSKMMDYARGISTDKNLIRQALDSFSDSEIVVLSYIIGLSLPPQGKGGHIRDWLIETAASEEKLPILTGELMRRNPKLLDFKSDSADLDKPSQEEEPA